MKTIPKMVRMGCIHVYVNYLKLWSRKTPKDFCGLHDIHEGSRIGLDNCFSDGRQFISCGYGHQSVVFLLTIPALRMDTRNSMVKLAQLTKHLIFFLCNDEAGNLDMSNMNHVNDSALDESRQHRAKSEVPALEKAERQNDYAVHEEQNVSHRNVPFSRHDGAKNIESAGRASNTQ